MFGSQDEGTVTCIACGDELPRGKAREYDKEGDRWKRDDKEFEHLCKPCDRGRSHQPRRGLEASLIASGAGTVDRSEFLTSFCSASEGQQMEDR